MGKGNGFKIFYAISFAWQLGFIVAIPIAGFLLLGFFADKKIGTSPLFVILGIILGITITISELYHWISILTKHNK